jgi:hypothetical protein
LALLHEAAALRKRRKNLRHELPRGFLVNVSRIVLDALGKITISRIVKQSSRPVLLFICRGLIVVLGFALETPSTILSAHTPSSLKAIIATREGL